MKQPKQYKLRWLTLMLYKNCFNDDLTHLGLKYRGVYYCITHSKGYGVEIPKKYLKMLDISKRKEYFKCCTSIPIIQHKTRMKIDEKFVIQAILDSELNKIKQNESK